MNLATLFSRSWEILEQVSGERLEVVIALASDEVFLAASMGHLVATKGNDGVESLLKLLPRDIDLLDSDKEFSQLLVLAQCIDHWFHPLVNEVTDLSLDLAYARQSYFLDSRLNDSGQRQLILKPARWARSEDSGEEGQLAKLSDLFENLFLLPKEISAECPDRMNPEGRQIGIEFELVAPWDTGSGEAGLFDASTVPVVGFHPIAVNEEDLPIFVKHEDGRDWYVVSSNCSIEKVESAIEALIDKGAHIIALPEMVLTGDNVALVQEYLASLASRENNNLCFLVLGAGALSALEQEGEVHNEGILLDRYGREILRQKKLHRWNIDLTTAERFGLDVAMPKESEILYEYMIPGDLVKIVELSGVGRVGVMVCEDLQRSKPGEWLRQNLYLDWVFSPIMSGPTGEGSWEKKTAVEIAAEGISRIVVSNSVSLTKRQNRINELPDAKYGPVLDPGIGLCVAPWSSGCSYNIVRYSISGSGDSGSTIRWNPGEWEKNAADLEK